MSVKMCALVAVLVIALGMAQVINAGPLQDAIAIFNSGDHETALSLMRSMANEGNVDAQTTLGALYLKGRGVTQDFDEARKWFQLAATQGDADAQNFLGGICSEGIGVAPDYVEGVKWYRLAANQGNAAAQNSLGASYSEGLGVPQDFPEAVRWYRLSADQGNATGQFNLGIMYYKGQGVLQDHVEAHKWFNLAGIGGMERAAKARAGVEGTMTPEQITLAQKLAKICLTSNYKQCGEPENVETTSIIPSTISHSPNKSSSGKVAAISMQKQGGTLVVPVLINNAISLGFIVDSGAADVSVPADVVLTLIRTGTLKQSDFLGEKVYVLADGSKVPSKTFRIRSMKVGDRVIENVTAAVAPLQGSLLLGQSFLSRFKSWSIDNAKQALLLE